MRKNQVSKVWKKIFIYPIGVRVEIVKDLAFKKWKTIGEKGEIIAYVSLSWKEHMLENGVYPASILQEVMYEFRPDSKPDGSEVWAVCWEEIKPLE